jgi:transcriptional regulator with XRE-family HTH domain
MPRLGEVLIKLREEAGLTRRALAKAAKIDPTVLARLEYGEREEVRLETFCRLADVFGISLDELAAVAGFTAKKRAPNLSAAAEVARLKALLEKVRILAGEGRSDVKQARGKTKRG